MSRVFTLAMIGLTLLATAAEAASPQRRAGAPLALPQDGSLLALHDLRREGNLVCIVGHTHTGSSVGMPSRKAAEVAAMRNWAEFTGWEYGSHWGNPSLSANKSMQCSGLGNKHSCDFESRPCRR